MPTQFLQVEYVSVNAIHKRNITQSHLTDCASTEYCSLLINLLTMTADNNLFTLLTQKEGSCLNECK